MSSGRLSLGVDADDERDQATSGHDGRISERGSTRKKGGCSVNLKISATRCGSMAAALVGSAVLVVGLSANAEAATGTLSWQGPNGQGWTLTNPPNGVCRTFNNTAAYG